MDRRDPNEVTNFPPAKVSTVPTRIPALVLLGGVCSGHVLLPFL